MVRTQLCNCALGERGCLSVGFCLRFVLIKRGLILRNNARRLVCYVAVLRVGGFRASIHHDMAVYNLGVGVL